MRILAVAAALILAAPVAAQTAGPITTETAVTPLRALGFGSLRGPATPVDAAHPLPTLCMTYSAGALVSCPSSSGGGDPSTTATAGGRVVAGLVNRRAYERAICLTGLAA